MTNITITFPNGDKKEFKKGITPLEIANSISEGLGRACVAANANEELIDINKPLQKNTTLELITFKDDRGKHVFWHSGAHLMAQAVKKLFPKAKPTIGPPLDEGGFYYDFANLTIKEEDLKKIEEEMIAIAKENLPIERIEFKNEKEALEAFKDNKFKQEIVQLAEEGLSAYKQGNYIDLCRGPHLTRTGMTKAAWIHKISGAYWRADAKNEQLTRLYGITFPEKKQLKEYKAFIEEAKKRDHRKIGKELDLFTISDQVGAGLILWTPKGSIIREELQQFIASHLRKQGYQQVFTPHIGRLALFKTSGHFPYYQESQFPPMIERTQLSSLAKEKCSCAELSSMMEEGNIEGYMLKPMNCPFHINIYNADMRSYRDLPMRLAEFGTVYRWEQSGEIGGMTRVRGFTQDDAHLFCTEEQVGEELLGCIELVKIIFNTLGMNDYRVRVGLRDPDSDKYSGTAEQWDKAEADCIAAAKSLGVDFTTEPGEAAFYGPKIDFVARDVLNREWQLGTIQVDYQLPQKFNLTYIASDGSKKRPVMIHRAPFGSMERFIGVLIEHFAGRFPVWLAPEQVGILPLGEQQEGVAKELQEKLLKKNIRSVLIAGGETLNKRIRDTQLRRIPATIIIGDKEVQAGTVALRTLDGKTAYGVKTDDFVKRIVTARDKRTLEF